MSKHMQISIKILPIYKGGMQDIYPKLKRHLGYLDTRWADKDPSPYDLAQQLDELLYHYEGTRLREALLPHRDKLQKLHKAIEKKAAEWKLAEADQLLYEMEDLFEEIEWKLD